MRSNVSIQPIVALQDATSVWKKLTDAVFETDDSLFLKMFVAHESYLARGCICLYHNPFIQINGKKTLVFGNMYIQDDKEIFTALVSASIEYARKKGYETLLGPINGNTWNNYRLPLDKFGVQFLTDLDQPEFYTRLLLDAGFTIAEKYYSAISEVHTGTVDPTLLNQLNEQGITIRNIRIENYEEELEKIFHFSQIVFSQNLYFSPASKEAFVARYIPLKKFIDPDLVKIAVDQKEEIKAIYFTFPDIIDPKRLIIKTLARVPGNDIKGIMTVISQQIYNAASEKGYDQIIHAFFHGDNRSRLLSEKFQGKPFKTYGLFVKEIDG